MKKAIGEDLFLARLGIDMRVSWIGEGGVSLTKRESSQRGEQSLLEEKENEGGPRQKRGPYR